MTDIAESKSKALENRNTIDRIEKYCNSKEEQQVNLEVKHHFSKGLYARELFIPAGVLLVGKIHKHKSLNILAQGDISLLTEDGFKRVQAPFTVVSEPGVKRVGYAHTDCVWITSHATEETDLALIEEEVIAKDYDAVNYLTDEDMAQIEELQRDSL